MRPFPEIPAETKWKWIAVCLLLFGSVVTSADGSRDSSFAPPPTSGPTFAIVYPLVHPFFETVTEQAVIHGIELGVNLIFRAPEGNNPAQQIRIMDDLIDSGVEGIALCATDPIALIPSVTKAMDKGIPVIAFESDMPGSKRICFLGTDNYNAGREMGLLLADVLGSEGSVIITTGLSTQMSLIQRIKGIQDVLEELHPNVIISDIRSGEGDPEKTYLTIEDQINDHPDFDVFTSIDATGGPAAVTIWKARGWRADDHMIVTFDDMSQNLDGIRFGIVTGIVSQKEWTWGPLIIERLLAITHGREVPEYHDTGTVIITKENVNNYRDD